MTSDNKMVQMYGNYYPLAKAIKPHIIKVIAARLRAEKKAAELSKIK